MKTKLFNSEYFHKQFGKWLFLEKVLWEYEGIPGLCVCTDFSGRRYFCHCTEMMDFERWCIHSISNSKIVDILMKNCTIEEGLSQTTQEVFVYTIDEDGEATKFLPYPELDEYDKPEEGLYLKSRPHEYDTYVDLLEENLMEIEREDALSPIKGMRTLWELIENQLTGIKIKIFYDEREHSTGIEDDEMMFFQNYECIYT